MNPRCDFLADTGTKWNGQAYAITTKRGIVGAAISDTLPLELGRPEKPGCIRETTKAVTHASSSYKAIFTLDAVVRVASNIDFSAQARHKLCSSAIAPPPPLTNITGSNNFLHDMLLTW